MSINLKTIRDRAILDSMRSIDLVYNVSEKFYSLQILAAILNFARN